MAEFRIRRADIVALNPCMNRSVNLAGSDPNSFDYGLNAVQLLDKYVAWSGLDPTANPLMFKPTQPRIGLLAGTANVAGSFTATFTHMEVDYFSKNPAP